MTQSAVEFGYYPRILDFVSGPITVTTLPGLDQAVADVAASETVDGDWRYSGPQLTRNLGGPVYERPYPRRVFDMPKTHTICHIAPDNADHIDFHVWALSFFLGMRLTTAEAGFLDATPLKPGKLVDFVLFDDGSKVPPIAEAFWLANRHEPIRATRWRAAVHALFIAQNPQSLQFEQFIYLYTAIDACFALAKALSPASVPKHLRHSERIDWMCKLYGMPTPSWADPAAVGNAQVANIRNPALHEALFMGEPLGFALHGIGTNQNLTLEMEALVCRLLAALIGVGDLSYLTSKTNTRQRHGLHL